MIFIIIILNYLWPVLKYNNEGNGWYGPYGNVVEVILKNHKNLAQHLVYASGSTNMVIEVLDVLEKNGLKRENMRSDVFEFINRGCVEIPAE